MSLWSYSLEEFRNKLSGPSPTPGGGSAAAVSAVFGAGLISMAAEIAAKKEGAAPEIEAGLPRLRELIEKLSAHADRDIAVYDQYVEARNRPKATQTELSERDAALSLALDAAAAAPLEMIEDSLNVLAAAEALAPLVHTGIISDVGAGAALVAGAIEAALFTVQSNIRLTKDEAKKRDLEKKCVEFARETEERVGRVAETVSKRLMGR